MKDAQKPDHISLTTLIGRLKEGRFVIPDFQRDFEWQPWDIRDLMRSIFLDYYIGSLLLWKGKTDTFKALACEPLYGFQGNDSREHIVLDGQQRLTAMYYAFTAPEVPAPNRANRYLYSIRVDKFMEEAYDVAFDYDWTRRGPKLLADSAAQYENHVFPLSIVGEDGWALPNWVQGYERFWQEKVDAVDPTSDDGILAKQNVKNARAFGEHLKAITEQYQVAYIELDQELALDKVCDIFTQINSKGIRLDVFDLVNALLKPKGLQLKHMWRAAAPTLEFIASDRANVYVLQVMSILLQAYCSPKYLYYLLPGQSKAVREPDGSLRHEVLVDTIEEFHLLWDRAVEALKMAIDLLRHPQEFGAISYQYLPYASILPAFAAMQTHARALPANLQLDAHRKIRLWYWASVFMNRYSGSVESTAARDFLDMKSWFDDDSVSPAVLREFQERFRSLDLRRETKRGTSIYNGIFNLLVLNGARDWTTGNLPQHGDLDDHHIVSQDWRKDHASVGATIDSILNRTPLTASTNRHVIRNRLPNAYLPEMIRENDEATVRTILESHFISAAAQEILLREPFLESDFEAFIAERHKTLLEAIEQLLIKERLDLSRPLRELDEKLEQVELGLREVVDRTLQGNVTKVPRDVLDRVEARVQVARRNPAVDQEFADSLAGKLEYFDLRELQDTITNRPLWPIFAEKFQNKETLVVKFGQLADLRNAIRHRRAVDEITRHEGEAAILWFEHTVGR
ncbi:MAG: GmrSD restriction endonuclease domain-containing protein [Acidimicrobiales bacterium]